MTLRGPVLTLLAVAALSAVLYLVNVRTAAQTETATQAGASLAPTQESAVPLAPPSGPAPPPPGPPPVRQQVAAYAGRTSGNEVTIAITVENGQAAAYVCDGKQIESWLEGSIADGQLTLWGSDGAKVTGAVQGDAVFGTVWVQGKQWAYSAQRAESPAGLYEGRGTVDGEPARVGWIVLPDGSQVGVVAIGEVRQPAPPLNPSRLGPVLLDGSQLVPRPVEGADPVLEPPS
ncbi:MAG: hypothetical protein ABR608_12435 [Pseudonocardiaceae bacterium]